MQSFAAGTYLATILGGGKGIFVEQSRHVATGGLRVCLPSLSCLPPKKTNGSVRRQTHAHAVVHAQCTLEYD